MDDTIMRSGNALYKKERMVDMLLFIKAKYQFHTWSFWTIYIPYEDYNQIQK